jgi:hypothetical protein
MTETVLAALNKKLVDTPVLAVTGGKGGNRQDDCGGQSGGCTGWLRTVSCL